MGEHDHMSIAQLRAKVSQRLAEGKPVGRLINSLQNLNQSTSQYQSQRTTSDIAAHVRWKSYQGKAATEETKELTRRSLSNSETKNLSTIGEHDHMSCTQLHAEVQKRLSEGKPVGRLIDSLQKLGEDTTQYQSQRTKDDIAAQIRMKSHMGKATPEETIELKRRDDQKHWWKFW